MPWPKLRVHHRLLTLSEKKAGVDKRKIQGEHYCHCSNYNHQMDCSSKTLFNTYLVVYKFCLSIAHARHIRRSLSVNTSIQCYAWSWRMLRPARMTSSTSSNLHEMIDLHPSVPHHTRTYHAFLNGRSSSFDSIRFRIWRSKMLSVK